MRSAGESPMLARRRVRIALREARDSLSLTQGDVADAMTWSPSKVIRIENGDVTISPNDLRAVLAYLKVSDSDVVESLVAGAKASRARKQGFWWRDEAYKGRLTPDMPRLFEFEREAIAIRYFSNYVIPGPLQTEAFAEAMLRPFAADADRGHHRDPGESLDEETVHLRATARRRRREDLLGPDGPEISVLLDESMVWRPYGGVEVLRGQLTDLEQLASRGRIKLRIVPLVALNAPLPTYGTFDLIYLGSDGDDENGVVYREFGLQDEIVEDRARVALYHAKFDELWSASIEEADTISLLRRRLTELTSSGSAEPS